MGEAVCPVGFTQYNAFETSLTDVFIRRCLKNKNTKASQNVLNIKSLEGKSLTWWTFYFLL